MKLNLLLLVLLTSSVCAQTPDKAKLDQFFDRLSEKSQAMGSLIMTKDGNVIYSRTIGYSQINGAEKKPLTASTKYRIGSVTKTFTATMIFQLIEEGKLKLDDKLEKFFPQITNANKITIQHILAHRSGIPDLADGSGKSTPKTQEQLLAAIIKGGSYFEPDTKYAYSNSGFVILGFIVEKITGKTYGEALKQRITSKIGLNDTYLGTGFADAAKNESYSYRYVGEWVQEPEAHLSGPRGAGAILSTPADLIQFITALFNGKLVSKKSVDLMMQKSLGMEPFTHLGKTFYGHAGGIDNFGSWLVYQPEEKLALAYTTNAKKYPVVDLINNVFDIYANKPFTIPSFESTVTVSTETLDKYVGVYSMEGAPKFTVTRQDNHLMLQMADRPANALEAIAENRFKAPNAPFEIEFDVVNKKMMFKRGDQARVFTREN